MPKKLHIDIETYSSEDLKKAGIYRYAEADDFDILLFAYAYDNFTPRVVDLAQGEKIPPDVIADMLDVNVMKVAHNAMFERVCLRAYFTRTHGYTIGESIGNPARWECTAVAAARLGLPMTLADVASVLKLQNQKDTEGKALIRYFSISCKPSKTNGQRTRNLPAHDLEKWEKYKAYNRQDVVVEQEIDKMISFYPLTQFEKDLYVLDQHINDRGVLIDLPFVHTVIEMDRVYSEQLLAEAVALTGLDNPKSTAQLKKWLQEELEDESIDKLRKEDVSDLLKTADNTKAERVLQIRQELNKTSNKKYTAMLQCVCKDGRVRGLFQFYGAGRTGRWAGRLVQMQNLPGTIYDEPAMIEMLRELAVKKDTEYIDLLFGSIPDHLSQLIRTAFIPCEGKTIAVSDFTAIEARVLAYLADEDWRLEVFRGDGKIYEASASKMFNVPLAEVSKALRKKGKISELALGYGGGVSALETMGALKMGLDKKELQPMVTAWRKANPGITGFWKACEKAAIEAVRTGVRQEIEHGIAFYTKNNVLFIELPSGRCLSYMRPTLTPEQLVEVMCIKEYKNYEAGKRYYMNLKTAESLQGRCMNITGDPFTKYVLHYEAMIQKTHKWGRESTYGGKIVENITQAFARDCLAWAMVKLDKAGYNIIGHVHDEIIDESAGTDIHQMEAIMGEEIPWAPGLPLGAEGFTSKFYRK